MHTRRRGDRVLGLAFWAGLLTLLAGLVLLAVVLITRGVDRANVWASVLGAGVAITGALIKLVRWWLRQRAGAGKPVTPEQLAQAAEGLRAVVFEQWCREARARSLGDPDPMPVRWRLSDPAVMDHDEHIASSVPLRFAGCSDQIAALTDQFRTLSRRRLVIIGPAGSGKTTLAVQLLLQLLEGWQAGEPVPVLFSLSSWDPQAQPEVQDWLAGQLAQTYPDLRTFGAEAAQKLADQDRILPVLDGLDEIPTERRGKVIDRLNASLHRDTGLILTSRTAEYTETAHTTDVLTAAAVVEPEELTASEAARYLEDRLRGRPDDSWQAVLTALRSGTAKALAEVVASPLELWLLRVVHIEGRRDPQPLIAPGRYSDATAIRQHLLDGLIPAVVHSRPSVPSGHDLLRPTHDYDPDQIRRWLTTLAMELRDAQISDWRWWQLARHTLTTRQIGLTFGLIGGLGVGLVYGLVFGPLFGLLCGLGGALLIGLLTARHYDAPAHIDLRVRGRARALGSNLTPSLVDGLVFGLLFGLVGWLRSVLPVVMLGLVLLGALHALIGITEQRTSSPAESQREDRVEGVPATSVLEPVFVLVFGLPLMLLVGLLTGLVLLLWLVLVVPLTLLGRALVDGLVLALIGLQFGLVGGLVGGLLLGLLFGLIHFAHSPSIAQRASSPTQSQRGDAQLTVLASSMLGLGSGLLFGLMFGLGGSGPVFGLVSGLVVMLAVGLLRGPTYSGYCWPTFIMASLWLAAHRRLPLSLMGFLDDAYRLGLLRIVGPVYQFRHDALQNHLAPRQSRVHR